MTPRFITFHCSATPNHVRYDIEKIRAYHKSQGWQDVGYHLVLQPDGEAQWGRGLNEVGAHVKGANRDNVGICVIGTDQFNYDQLWSMKHHTQAIMSAYDIPPWNLRAHCNFPSAIEQGKTCPNMRIENLIMWVVWGDIRAVEDYVRK